VSLSGAERYLDASTLFRGDDKARLFRPEILEHFRGYDPAAEPLGYLARARKGHWLSALQYLDIKHYLPLDILTKVDRMSMAHSLEARVPLLDHKLLEFVAAIPPELKLRRGTTKYIFKRALRGILPDAILDRPKWGFAVPLGEWFKGDLTGYVRELLLSERARQRGIFNPEAVETLLRLAAQGRPRDFQIWTLISFELWCRRFLDHAHPGRAVA
jgi:asparagine synthase (glutamine-hydrolysing)